MKNRNLLGTTAILALFAANAASADVTPEEVWKSWQDMAAAAGQSITAESATRDGDTLVVVGMTTSMSDPESGSKIEGNYDEVKFRDSGDGKVIITMSDVNPITVNSPAVEGENPTPAVDLVIEVSQPGMTITAGGSATETSYVIDAPIVGIKVMGIDAAVPTVTDAKFEVNLSGVSGTYLISGEADAKAVESNLAVKTAAFVMTGTDSADGGSSVDMTASIADLAAASKGNLVGMGSMMSFPDALKAGFTTDANFSHGAVSFDVNVTEAGTPTKITGALATGAMSFMLDATKLQYSSSQTGVSLTMQSPDIPFPEVNIAFAEAAFGGLMPVVESDTPADFSILTKIIDLTVSEEIWAMIDPGATLPRDPATVIVDVKGTATLTTDIMDEAAMAALGDAPPGMLNSLDITEIKATIAGAALTANGAFTFDNTDMVTFAPAPAPTGKLELKLVGANGLADKLVAMGLLAEEDVMGARMMISMFANSSPDADELTSTLEFKDKGFFANGQQLQ